MVDLLVKFRVPELPSQPASCRLNQKPYYTSLRDGTMVCPAYGSSFFVPAKFKAS